MTQYIQTKIARTFTTIEKKSTNTPGTTYKMRVRRDPQIKAQEREPRPCGRCVKPMMVSAGQIVRTHKACRRNIYGNKK